MHAEPMDFAELAGDVPDGLAVLGPDGCFAWLNREGCRLLGVAEPGPLGAPAPFAFAERSSVDTAGLYHDEPGERVTAWTTPTGPEREFAYRARTSRARDGSTVVAFRDVTHERHRQRRIAAIARSAAILASQGSLPAALDALAAEVLQADALAGIQIMTMDEAGEHLRVMGSAGFRHWPDFFDRLIACRERGARLHMLDALHEREPVVVAHRWEADRADPAWAPLHEYLGELHWDSFASLPLITRGRVVGVLNAFFAPGQTVSDRALEFLLAMAEQAAIAVDYAALMQHERDVVRRQERQRIARDLHDAIVQQVFSISMLAKSLEILAGRAGALETSAVEETATEVGRLSSTVLTDLRAMVHELRPSSVADYGGLGEALRALAESTANRTGLRFRITAGQGLEIDDEIAEDVYRVLAEAVHNVVKHAQATSVTIWLGVRGGDLRASVADDGRGVPRPEREASDGSSGYGFATMRERAQRWGGAITISPRGRGRAGTIVRLAVPLAFGVDVAAEGPWLDALPETEVPL